MKKKILFGVIGVIAILVILEAVEMVQSGRWRGGAIFAVFVVVAVPIVILFARPKPVKVVEELDDDEGGIDWREENVSEEEFAMWKGWAVLMDDVAVHEAKAAAETLEKAQIRCRLELLKEDRAWHRFGNGGLGTRMCVLVAPSDYAAARKIV